MTTYGFLFSQEAGSARLSLAAFGETTEANERVSVCAASAIGNIGLDREEDSERAARSEILRTSRERGADTHGQERSGQDRDRAQLGVGNGSERSSLLFG